jgi:rhodanese-related sulfurtransferase
MEVPEVGVDELATVLGAGAPLVDVRMPDEYERIHVPGAVLVPLPELVERLDDIPDRATVYLICATGSRSHRACEYLITQGYDAVNVGGGTRAWVDSGRSVVTGPQPG